jgi:hypothetical protein
MEYKLKPLTLAQRAECNNQEIVIEPGGGVRVKNLFSTQLLWLKHGLESLNGVILTADNFDIEVNKLSVDEIRKLADEIAEATNFSKKK